MKYVNHCLLLMIFAGIFLATACKNEDDGPVITNEISIRILEPVQAETYSDPTNINVSVEIEATEENHEIEIVLVPLANENVRIIDFTRNAPDKLITFEQTVNLSGFPFGQGFQLEVKACLDQDCTQREVADVEFFIE